MPGVNSHKDFNRLVLAGGHVRAGLLPGAGDAEKAKRASLVFPQTQIVDEHAPYKLATTIAVT